MFRRTAVSTAIIFLISTLSILAFSWTAFGHGKKSHGKQISISAEQLPGVTWADDIHPIFIRNKCYDCHTRGDEDIVENLSEFALGLIDQEDPGNSYFSFHELVYTEGAANKINGETLRDGQCCWPRGFPESQQRRIWLGYPERSALLRKLDRDYYDWNKPPRYLEEGLRLSWGLPMPMWSQEGEEDGSKKEEKKKDSLSTSVWKEIWLRVKLLAGRGQEELSVLPAPIPASDRALIRDWINNTIQLRSDGTSLTVRLKGGKNRQIENRGIRLVGKYVNHGQEKISDFFDLKTDGEGVANIQFQKGSVVSLQWHVGLKIRQDEYKYIQTRIVPGAENSIAY